MLISPNFGIGWPLILKPDTVAKTAPRVVGAVLNVFIGVGNNAGLAASPPPSQLNLLSVRLVESQRHYRYWSPTHFERHPLQAQLQLHLIWRRSRPEIL